MSGTSRCTFLAGSALRRRTPCASSVDTELSLVWGGCAVPIVLGPSYSHSSKSTPLFVSLVAWIGQRYSKSKIPHSLGLKPLSSRTPPYTLDPCEPEAAISPKNRKELLKNGRRYAPTIFKSCRDYIRIERCRWEALTGSLTGCQAILLSIRNFDVIVN